MIKLLKPTCKNCGRPLARNRIRIGFCPPTPERNCQKEFAARLKLLHNLLGDAPPPAGKNKSGQFGRPPAPTRRHGRDRRDDPRGKGDN